MIEVPMERYMYFSFREKVTTFLCVETALNDGLVNVLTEANVILDFL